MDFNFDCAAQTLLQGTVFLQSAFRNVFHSTLIPLFFSGRQSLGSRFGGTPRFRPRIQEQRMSSFKATANLHKQLNVICGYRNRASW
jgi:hypothetical protein